MIAAFQDTDAGKDVEFKESYGASGDQTRAVVAGQDADEVHLSLEPDVTRLVDEGLVAEDWKDNDTKGICTQSVVVIVVQHRQPQGHRHLGRPDQARRRHRHAQPGLLRLGQVEPARGVRRRCSPTAAPRTTRQAYMKKFFGNVAALPDSGRDATTAFTSGTGDVLLSYENEAILARQSGTGLRLRDPGLDAADREPVRGHRRTRPKAAQAFLDFQKSADGQKLYAETGYRPLVDVGDVEVEGANDPSNPFPEPAHAAHHRRRLRRLG